MIKAMLAEAGCNPLNDPTKVPVTDIGELAQMVSPAAKQVDRTREKLNDQDLTAPALCTKL
jgi:hypothetical protein